jgi:hypothetical protein
MLDFVVPQFVVPLLLIVLAVELGIIIGQLVLAATTKELAARTKKP